MIRVSHHVNTVYSSVSYVLFNDEERTCWVVDVGDCDKICKMIGEYELRGIFLTHVHYDHIYGLNNMQVLYPQVPIYTNNFGLESLSRPDDNLSAYHGDNFILLNMSNVQVVKEGELIDLGCESIRILETPGHDFSCLSYLTSEFCFTGDAYIPGVKVFTKLQNGNSVLAELSKDKLEKILQSGYKICPGHLCGVSI